MDFWGLENVYFIYTFSDSTKDRWMKRFERGTINDDVKYLEEKGLTVAVIESGTKQDVINAINDPEAIVVVTSGHGDRTGIVTADGGRFRPSDVDPTQVSQNLQTVIFENCYQGDIETKWENAFGNDVDVVGWESTTNTPETRSFNGFGWFDGKDKDLRDYLNDAVDYKNNNNLKGE